MKSLTIHQHHQRIGGGMHVPAEFERGVQGDDDQQAGADIDMGRGPALKAAGSESVAALANTKQHHPEDQDGAEGVTEPGTAVWLEVDCGGSCQTLSADCQHAQADRQFQITTVPALGQ